MKKYLFVFSETIHTMNNLYIIYFYTAVKSCAVSTVDATTQTDSLVVAPG